MVPLELIFVGGKKLSCRLINSMIRFYSNIEAGSLEEMRL